MRFEFIKFSMVNWDNFQFCYGRYRKGRIPSQTKQYTSTPLCYLTIKEIIIKHHKRNMFFFPKKKFFLVKSFSSEIHVLFFFSSTKCQSLQIFSIPAQKRCFWLPHYTEMICFFENKQENASVQNNSCNSHLYFFLHTQNFSPWYTQRFLMGYFSMWSRNG